MKHSKHAHRFCSAYMHVHTRAHAHTHTHPYTSPPSPPEVTTIWKMPRALPEHEYEHAVVLSNTHSHIFEIYPH